MRALARSPVGNVVPRKVAICEDQLDNRYRFLPGRVAADVPADDGDDCRDAGP